MVEDMNCCAAATRVGAWRAIDDSLVAAVRLTAHLPDVECWDDPDLVLTCSPLPGRPSDIVRLRFELDSVERRITSVEECFRRYGASPKWWLSPSTRPEDLAQRLEWRGFAHLAMLTGMVVRLPVPPSDIDEPSGYELVEVRDGGPFNGVHPSFGNLTVDHAWGQLTTRVQLSTLVPRRLWHFCACLAGTPVSTATLIANDSLAGIYDVAVAPEARGRGIGTVVIHDLLRRANSLGCRMAVVHATDGGAGVYRSIGFRSVCELQVWGERTRNRSCGVVCRPDSAPPKAMYGGDSA